MNKMCVKFDVGNTGESGEFNGYASVFNMVDSDKDVVEPGAFEATIDKCRETRIWPSLLWSHDSYEPPIGVYTDMREDTKGLFVSGRLFADETARAKEVYACMKAGAVSGLSIGYRVVRESYDAKKQINLLQQIDLREVSLVNFPANDAARITAVKSIKTIRDFERFLRDSGYSRAEALDIASHGFKGAGQRESGVGEAIEKLIQSITK